MVESDIMREKIPISMRMTKKQIYHAGKENYFYTLRLQEENDKMKVNLASALNTLKLVLEGLPQLTFMFDDDGDAEELDVTPPEKEKRDMEVQ